MGRYRSRSRSYSPPRSSRRSRTPPPKRRHYEDPRDRRSSRRSPAPTGLLVRNISLDARPEDLRIPFERFGAVKDVYIPKNYYTGEPRGFGFVKFRNPEDAAEAKHHLNHSVIGGREIAIVFAEENRKTPQEMCRTSRVSERYGGSRKRQSPPRSPRHRYHSHSRSPSPARHASSQKKEYRDHSCQKKEFVQTREWKFSKVLIARSKKKVYLIGFPFHTSHHHIKVWKLKRCGKESFPVFRC